MKDDMGAQFYDRIVTGDEKWFCYYDPLSKQQSMEWCTVGSPPPVKPHAERSAGKRMAIVFWDCDGILLIKWLPEKQTITGLYYCKILTELREAIKTQRRGKLTHGVLLQHDNARPHTAYLAVRTIRELGFDVLPHPPYSPDLAPSDYFRFGEMAKVSRGKRYKNIQELSGDLGRWAKDQPREWFRAGIEKLEDRWRRCIAREGDYVEATA